MCVTCVTQNGPNASITTFELNVTTPTSKAGS
jgi:hypothetical protein